MQNGFNKSFDMQILIVVSYFVWKTVNGVDQGLEDEEIQAQEYIQELNYEIQMRRNQEANAEWDYYSNITDATEKRKLEVSTENAKFYKVSRMCGEPLKIWKS